jgi:CheY-like chemotaxis protein
MTRVLVVEDDEGVAEAISMALEDRYEILQAHNGQQALALLATTPVDLVVLDLMMPVMDGHEFMDEFRAAGGTTPVIVASASPDLAHHCARIGAQDFLSKPYDLDALLEKIRRLLGSGDGGASAAPDGGVGPGTPTGGGGEWTMPSLNATVSPWPVVHPQISYGVRRATTTSSSSTRTSASSPMWSSASSPPA